ncbi:NfeD family protein [Chloroflexota bacterium]
MTGKKEKSEMNAWLIVLISLIDDIIIVAVVILALWYFKVKLPWWAIVLITLALGAFIFVRTWYVVPSIRRKKVTGAEGMIGLECEVIEPLTPNGTIRIGAEYWLAKSIEGDIAAGESVEILKIERLKIEVRRKVP